MRRTIGSLIVAAALAVTACGSATQPAPVSTAGSSAPASVADSAAAVGAAELDWSYEGDTGPDNWGDIAPACATTTDSSESPIDIQTASLAADPAATMTMQYIPAAFEVEDNGHTIEAVPQDTKQNSVTIDGATYYLQQFHFHAQSEHLIDGANAPMELHLVHGDDAGRLAVLGVLLDSGAASEPLAELFASLPVQENETAPVELQDDIDLSLMLPSDRTLARYAGSLTTPPCTEGVRWNVFLKPMTLSAEQIAAYSGIYPNNSRPVQPLNGRAVVQIDAGS